jgi:hypothetical protein
LEKLKTKNMVMVPQPNFDLVSPTFIAQVRRVEMYQIFNFIPYSYCVLLCHDAAYYGTFILHFSGMRGGLSAGGNAARGVKLATRT